MFRPLSYLRRHRRRAIALTIYLLLASASWHFAPNQPRLLWTFPNPKQEFFLDFTTNSLSFVTNEYDDKSVIGHTKGPIRFRKLETGEIEKQFEEADRNYWRVIVSPNAEILALLEGEGNHQQYRLVDIASGKTLKIFKLKPKPRRNLIYDEVKFSLDKKTFAIQRRTDKSIVVKAIVFDEPTEYILESVEIQFWDFHAGTERSTIKGYYSSGVFSPDGTLYAVVAQGYTDEVQGGTKKQIHIFEVQNGREIAAIEASGGTVMVYNLVFSPDGRFFAFGISDYGGIKVYDVSNWRLVHRISGVENISRFLDNGNWLVTNLKSEDLQPGAVIFNTKTWEDRLLQPDIQNGPYYPEYGTLLGSATNRDAFPERTVVGLYRFKNASHELIDRILHYAVHFKKQDGPIECRRAIDSVSGEVLATFENVLGSMISPDGRAMFVRRSDRDGQEVVELWNITPHKPWNWLLGLWSVLALFFAAVWRRQLRRARRLNGEPRTPVLGGFDSRESRDSAGNASVKA